jgi:hypothetical protein
MWHTSGSSSDRRYLFQARVLANWTACPDVTGREMMATFDRADALNRDDIQFFYTRSSTPS